MTSDTTLVDRAAAGDRDAFASLVDRHQRLVVGVAFAITRDRALAEDIGQDAFVAAWRGLAGLTDRSRVAPWLAGIARNLANNTMRKQARRKAYDDRRDDRGLAPTPHDHVAARERQALVRETLDELPEAQREALVLFYFEDRSVEHVAAGLGVTRDVVKQRLHRAREAARARLTERLESTLEAMRPSAAFTAAVIGAIAVGAVTDATAATTSVATHTGGHAMFAKIAIAAAIIGSAGTATLVAARHRGSTEGSTPAASHVTEPGLEHAGRAHVHPTARVAASADRARVADAIRAARQGRTPPTLSRSQSQTGPGSPDPLSEYLRDATIAIAPLLMECLPHTEDEAASEGQIKIRCTVDSEPEVGAVISSSEIVDADTTVANPQVRDCIRDTMYAIELDPAEIPASVTFETLIGVGDGAAR
jgi:RNA polymerase sigma-70 factor (ECF subfamily)